MSDDVGVNRDPEYRGADRRRKPPQDPVAAAIWALKEDLDLRHDENVGRSTDIKQQIRELSEKVDDISKGFADDDPVGHRKYHESLIKKNEQRAELYQAIRAELLSKGIWAAIGFAAIALWVAFKTKVMQ
jgi:hypothetical protein